MSSARPSSTRSPALLVVALTAAAVLLAWMLDQSALGQRIRPARAAGPGGIVSLSPAITETLFAIGAGHQIAGVSDFCDLLRGSGGIARTGTGLTPDYERIARLGPTLILTDGSAPTRHEPLSVLGTTATLPWLTLDEVLASIRRLGELTRRRTAATELAERMRARLAVQPPADAPRVLVAHGIPIQDAGEIWYIQPDCLHGAVLRAAGGKNAMPAAGTHPPRMGLERLLEIDPDLIVILAGPDRGDEASRRRLLAGYQSLAELRAVREGRIGVVQGQAVFATGPRILELADALKREIDRLEAAP